MIAALRTYADRNQLVKVPAGYDVIAQARKNAAASQ